MFAATQPRTRGCVTDLASPALTINQLQGTGIVLNKSLVVPLHFGHSLNSIEFVQIQPESSVGEHVQETDEIYFLTQGVGELTTNGEKSVVRVGDLILAPRFTRHSIRNTDAFSSLNFLVIEVKTRSYVSCSPMAIDDLFGRLQSTKTLLSAWVGPERQCVPIRACTIDLMQYFTGGWGHLSLMELPPGCRVNSYALPDDEDLLIYKGHATIEVDGRLFQTDEEGKYGLNAYVPAGVERSLINRSSVELLYLLSVRLHPENE